MDTKTNQNQNHKKKKGNRMFVLVMCNNDTTETRTTTAVICFINSLLSSSTIFGVGASLMTLYPTIVETRPCGYRLHTVLDVFKVHRTNI